MFTTSVTVEIFFQPFQVQLSPKPQAAMIKFFILLFAIFIFDVFCQEAPTPPGVYVDNACFCVTAGQCKDGTSVNSSTKKPG